MIPDHEFSVVFCSTNNILVIYGAIRVPICAVSVGKLEGEKNGVRLRRSQSSVGPTKADLFRLFLLSMPNKLLKKYFFTDENEKIE